MKKSNSTYLITMLITHLLPTFTAFVAVMLAVISIILNNSAVHFFVPDVIYIFIAYVYPITAIVCGVPALILDIKHIKVCKSTAAVTLLVFNALRLLAALIGFSAVVFMMLTIGYIIV